MALEAGDGLEGLAVLVELYLVAAVEVDHEVDPRSRVRSSALGGAGGELEGGQDAAVVDGDGAFVGAGLVVLAQGAGLVGQCCLECRGALGDGVVDARDGGDVGADEEGGHAVLGAADDLGEAGLPGALFLLAGDRGGGGGDLAGHECLEAAPGDATVGRLGDLGVDVCGLGAGELAGLGDHVAGVGGAHLEGLHPCPQRRVAVVEVLGVADQAGRGPGGDPDTGAELGGGELGDLRDPLTAVAARPLTAGQSLLVGVEPVRGVHDRPVVGDDQQLDLGLAGGARAGSGPVEDLGLAQVVQRRLHAPILLELEFESMGLPRPVERQPGCVGQSWATSQSFETTPPSSNVMKDQRQNGIMS